MTDKVKKIRNEVERLQNELIQEKEKGYGSDVDDACILELQNVLTYIDSLQEEPVSEDLEEVAHQYYMPNETFMDGFKKGANWKEKQIMRSATDGQLENGEDYLRIKCLSMGCHSSECDGKFVKLIIIKED